MRDKVVQSVGYKVLHEDVRKCGRECFIGCFRMW